ncbi:MAG TPA: hypothetical protein VL523_06425 [Terriglobia bacterium]|nr:hypothetical protein [Terriglobia bacterium]
MHGNPDHHDAELLLRLYDLRREERLRRARDWFIREFHASSAEEFQQRCAPGTDESAFFRMTITYWDMAASVVNHGLIQEQFFFENNGEFWLVWAKASVIVPGLRERSKNPHLYANLEKLALKYEKWMAERSPGYIESRRQQLGVSPGQAPGRTAP